MLGPVQVLVAAAVVVMLCTTGLFYLYRDGLGHDTILQLVAPAALDASPGPGVDGAPAALALSDLWRPRTYAVRTLPLGAVLPPELRDVGDPVAPEISLLDALAAMAPGERIAVVTASCGADVDDLLVWLKALLVFGAADGVDAALALFDVHIVIDTASVEAHVRAIVDGAWGLAGRLQVSFHNASMIAGTETLYRPCTTQRLTLASLLPALSRILYLDRDMIVLRDLRPLWSQARRFGPRQCAALAVVAPRAHLSYYRKPIATVPAWGLAGVNGGVFLADLACLRRIHFEATMTDLYLAHRDTAVLRLGDQDLLNLWLHAEPDRIVPLACHWNVRDSCFPVRNVTALAEMSILHLNQGVHRSLPLSFPALAYDAVLRWPVLPLPAESIDRARTRLAHEAPSCIRHDFAWTASVRPPLQGPTRRC